MDAGIYAHQVRVTPDGRHAVLVTRGNEGTPQRPEDPGGLMVFDYQDGVLSNQDKIAPNGGRAMARAIWIFIRPSRGSSCRSKRRISCTCTACRVASRYRKSFSTRRHSWSPAISRSRQAASTVHVHPNGRFVYGANRSQDVVDFRGKKVYKGGENSIVVYSINQQTGEPSAIQHIEATKFHPRTFHIEVDTC
jgi:6-phosphogluconolactonase